MCDIFIKKMTHILFSKRAGSLWLDKVQVISATIAFTVGGNGVFTYDGYI